MRLESKIELYQDEYEQIAFSADSLIEKINKNKLLKEDRLLLESAVALIYEIRANQEG